jgi:integrase
VANRGIGRVYRRGDTWWIRYSLRGERVRESSGSPHRADAVALLRERLVDAAQGRVAGPKAQRVSLDDLGRLLLDNYALNGRKSVYRAQLSLRHLCAWFGANTRAVDITPGHIAQYVKHRRAEGARPATARNELAALKRAFNLALSAGLIPTKPAFPTVSVSNARRGFFEESEFQAVAAHLPEALRDLAHFLYLTGWRKGEALALQWDQVDMQAGVLRIEDSKNGEPRTLPFRALPELAMLFTRLRACTDAVERVSRRPVAPVFHRSGRPIRDFRGAWRKACVKAGLAGRIPHDFRRTAVRNMERAGVSRSVAMQVTGHKTESIYRRYAITSEADIAEGLSKVARLREKIVASLKPPAVTRAR